MPCLIYILTKLLLTTKENVNNENVNNSREGSLIWFQLKYAAHSCTERNNGGFWSVYVKYFPMFMQIVCATRKTNGRTKLGI